MRKITFSLLTAVALSSVGFAGGDIQPVEPVVETPAVVEPAPEVKFYVGAGVSLMSFDFDNAASYETSWTGGTFLAGIEINEYIAIEGRYANGFGSADVKENGVDITASTDFKMDNLAIYLKPMLPLGDLSLYGLIGYGKTTIEDAGTERSDTGLQWGVGASMAFNENLSAFVDYTVMYDDDTFDTAPITNVSSDAITIGLTYTF